MRYDIHSNPLVTSCTSFSLQGCKQALLPDQTIRSAKDDSIREVSTLCKYSNVFLELEAFSY